MKTKHWIFGVVGLIAILVAARWGLYLLQSDEPLASESMATPSNEVVIDDAYRTAQASAQEAEQHEASFEGEAQTLDAEALYALAAKDLPESLQGTEIDGSFRLDDQGNLIIEPQVLRVFEYFMTGIGEEDLQTIVQRVRRLIDAALPVTAQDDAKLLLAQYLDYREQQSALLEAGYGNSADLVGLRESFSQLKQLRREVFGAEHADALFASKEAYTRFNLNTMELTQRGGELSEMERIERTRQLASQLPPERRQQVEERLVQRELDHRTASMKEEGASAEELRQMRAQLVGVEAAERLGALDEERAAWDQRVARFRNDLDSALQDAGDIDDSQREAIVERVLSQHQFSDTEALRVKATQGLL
ncbi:lipase chaperone [gamma proteobacterium HTCC5015]|nr:lipase chaperone [gamma proteobacterium HTCC5015]